MASNSTEKKKKAFLNTYKAVALNISKACEAAGVGRRTFYTWITEGSPQYDHEFAERVWELEEELKDYAEVKLMANIRKGKEQSIIFFLRTKAKERGYTTASESAVTVTGDVQVTQASTEEFTDKSDEELRAYIDRANELLGDSNGETA